MPHLYDLSLPIPIGLKELINQGNPTFTPNGNTQTAPAGYYGGVTVQGVALNIATGSITPTTLGTYYVDGVAYSSSWYQGIVPVPAGATKIIAVILTNGANPNTSQYSANATYAFPTGYADGISSGTPAVLIASNGTWSSIQWGGNLSLSTSSINVPVYDYTYNYVLLFV